MRLGLGSCADKYLMMHRRYSLKSNAICKGACDVNLCALRSSYPLNSERSRLNNFGSRVECSLAPNNMRESSSLSPPQKFLTS